MYGQPGQSQPPQQGIIIDHTVLRNSHVTVNSIHNGNNKDQNM